ncbi:MAG TPA: flagellar biosynthetic protein FliO [Ramlibacter sp.]|nr:flagellar biosynthetic protein FliO [Ramlibacter sp.]
MALGLVGATADAQPQAAASAPATAASSPGAAPPVFGNLPLQRETDRADAGVGGWLPQLVAAVLLVAAGGFAYHWRRTRAPLRATGSSLRSAAALRLTPAASVHVVHWGEEELLLACTPSAVTLVAKRPRSGGDIA